MGAINLNKTNFERVTSKSNKPVLIDCWSTWCGPCRMQLPIIDALAQELRGIAVVTKLNLDENPELTARFSVVHVPTLIILKDGKELGRKSGFMLLSKLRETLISFGLEDATECAL
jgi:thioredoxin 1